ncbi:MAG: hypothetical protein WC252_08450, partial [Candidatus Cloacimonadaceae bacterium]
MNQPNIPKGTKINVDINAFRMKPWLAAICSLLLVAYVLYFHLPVLNLKFLSWIPALAIVLLPLWGISKLRKGLTFFYAVMLVLLIILPLI